MGFRFAGFRPAALGYAAVLIFALSASGVAAQSAPAKATTAANPAAATPAAPTTTAAAAPAAAEAAAKPGDATAGQAKAAACGACHGMDGNSTDPQYPKLAGQSEQYIVRQLENFKSGKRQNPIMLGMATPLSEQDMHDVGAYFASKTALPGVADQALVERGQQLFREGDVTRGIPACMACHSADGRGNPGAEYPQLESQHAQYIEAQLKAWHDGNAWGTDAHSQIMPSIAQKLNANDIAAVASYIEGLHPAAVDPQQAASP
ncbi:cytochrome c4 [Rhodanobacter sp. 7MK24]|uniref:c-type cytochrome n=1 Tax=Rhodanobacter sp. 7MK24 TaxID=2775922 RepID=UPI0017871AC2|nr:c-type cytochrome [Rhodanobacter sp. 7MK24]MBD8879844.1 cytochrome c4 [Rhodanobacter sp. 7MK24]